MMRGRDSAASARRSSQQRFSAALAADMLWLPQGLQAMNRDITRDMFYGVVQGDAHGASCSSLCCDPLHPRPYLATQAHALLNHPRSGPVRSICVVLHVGS